MKTIIFDLDGTLSITKNSLDDEMVAFIGKLLISNNVAIVSGASWKQVNKQINNLGNIEQAALNNLYIIPASGGSLYQSWPRYGWVAAYQHKLTPRDIEYIMGIFNEAILESGFEHPQKLWGKQLDIFDSNKVVFSALGQRVPLDVKEKWDIDGSKRKGLVEALRRKLPSYEVRIAGMNSIDVSIKGINKKFGIDELIKKLRVNKDDVVYVGNSIFKGGSDYVAVEMGLHYVSVRDPEDTKAWIRGILDGAEQILQAKG